MRTTSWIRTVLVLVLLTLTFSPPAEAGDKAAGGALIGAGSGALLGHAIGGTTESTVVGTALGSIVGLVIGLEMENDHRDYRPEPVHYRPYRPQTVYYGDRGWEQVDVYQRPWPRHENNKCRQVEIPATVNGRHRYVTTTACKESGKWVIRDFVPQPRHRDAYGYREQYRQPMVSVTGRDNRRYYLVQEPSRREHRHDYSSHHESRHDERRW